MVGQGWGEGVRECQRVSVYVCTVGGGGWVCVCVLGGAPNGLFTAIWLIKTWKGPSGSRVLIVVIGVNKVPLHALITSIVSSRRANWAGLNTDGRRDGRKRGKGWRAGGGGRRGEGDLAVIHATCFCMLTPCSPLSGAERLINWKQAVKVFS